MTATHTNTHTKSDLKGGGVFWPTLLLITNCCFGLCDKAWSTRFAR